VPPLLLLLSDDGSACVLLLELLDSLEVLRPTVLALDGELVLKAAVLALDALEVDRFAVVELDSSSAAVLLELLLLDLATCVELVSPPDVLLCEVDSPTVLLLDDSLLLDVDSLDVDRLTVELDELLLLLSVIGGYSTIGTVAAWPTRHTSF